MVLLVEGVDLAADVVHQEVVVGSVVDAVAQGAADSALHAAVDEAHSAADEAVHSAVDAVEPQVQGVVSVVVVAVVEATELLELCPTSTLERLYLLFLTTCVFSSLLDSVYLC